MSRHVYYRTAESAVPPQQTAYHHQRSAAGINASASSFVTIPPAEQLRESRPVSRYIVSVPPPGAAALPPAGVTLPSAHSADALRGVVKSPARRPSPPRQQPQRQYAVPEVFVDDDIAAGAGSNAAWWRNATASNRPHYHSASLHAAGHHSNGNGSSAALGGAGVGQPQPYAAVSVKDRMRSPPHRHVSPTFYDQYAVGHDGASSAKSQRWWQVGLDPTSRVRPPPVLSPPMLGSAPIVGDAASLLSAVQIQVSMLMESQHDTMRSALQEFRSELRGALTGLEQRVSMLEATCSKVESVVHRELSEARDERNALAEKLMSAQHARDQAVVEMRSGSATLSGGVTASGSGANAAAMAAAAAAAARAGTPPTASAALKAILEGVQQAQPGRGSLAAVGTSVPGAGDSGSGANAPTQQPQQGSAPSPVASSTTASQRLRELVSKTSSTPSAPTMLSTTAPAPAAKPSPPTTAASTGAAAAAPAAPVDKPPAVGATLPSATSGSTAQTSAAPATSVAVSAAAAAAPAVVAQAQPLSKPLAPPASTTATVASVGADVGTTAAVAPVAPSAPLVAKGPPSPIPPVVDTTAAAADGASHSTLMPSKSQVLVAPSAPPPQTLPSGAPATAQPQPVAPQPAATAVTASTSEAGAAGSRASAPANAVAPTSAGKPSDVQQPQQQHPTVGASESSASGAGGKPAGNPGALFHAVSGTAGQQQQTSVAPSAS